MRLAPRCSLGSIASLSIVLFLLCLTLVDPSPATAQSDFIAFESGPVRPIVLSPDGTHLFVANIPDAHLEVWDLTPASGPEPVASIPVGLEPVAIAALDDDEVWVVNHLSDSVSIVRVSERRVVRTLLVGDEPRDIVVADPPDPGIGPRVFITTAHRGPQRQAASLAGVPGAGDPQLTTPGVGRADVWVFDPAHLGATLGGTPLEILSFFADTPRALAVHPDGSEVYVAAFHSGNQTTTVSEGIVCDGFASAGSCGGDGITSPGGLAGGLLPGGNPGPDADHNGVAAPEVGLIVQWNDTAGEFQDEDGRNWTNGVRFTLPDRDVFAIDAATLTQSALHSGVGTILFNMIANPVSGKLYVSNTEAGNLTRFEGPGLHGGSTVQGDLARSRITVLPQPGSSASTVLPRHLNKHIDYTLRPAPPGVASHSLATPTDLAISPDGATLYVAAFGSSAIGVFDTNALENDTFVPDVSNHLPVSGGGPGGLALSADGTRLYVYTRFDNAFSVLDTTSGSELFHLSLPNPEPDSVLNGRRFLYDAVLTSSNGEASCASCHIFGDLDGIAWDLGNPDDAVTTNPMSIDLSDTLLFTPPPVQNGGAGVNGFHPMKGPMTTQTLRGLRHSGAMHWRGDRSNGFFGIDATDEEQSFKNFIIAFSGLVGRASDPSEAEMQAFSDFALELTLPPNPVRALDNQLTPDEQAGRDFYFGPRRSDGASSDFGGFTLGATCQDCHALDPALGLFGTDRNSSLEAETQTMKVPHLRNAYQKIGMFGAPHTQFELNGNNGHQGEQIRGFGFLHDGSTDTLFRFFRAVVFAGQADPATGFVSDLERRQMERFMLAFDSDLAPIVGQQITLTNANAATVDPRIDLLIERADAGFVSRILGGSTTECDLIAKGVLAGEAIGWLYTGGGPGVGSYDASDGTTTTDAALRALSSETDLTFTCVPPGSGVRMGLNRDRDLHLDSLDNCPGTPNDAQLDSDADSIGDACDPTPVPEAGDVAMLLAGGAALTLLKRRRGRGSDRRCGGGVGED